MFRWFIEVSTASADWPRMLCTMTGVEPAEDEAVSDRLQNPATGALAERPAMLDGLQEVARGHVRYEVAYCQYGADMVRYPRYGSLSPRNPKSVAFSRVCAQCKPVRELSRHNAAATLTVASHVTAAQANIRVDQCIAARVCGQNLQL